MQILKRDGRKVEFDRQKIVNAIKKSFKSVDGEVSDYASEKAENIADYITQRVNESDKPFDVEMIQDLVEHGLMSCKRKDVAKAYILYRDERNRSREERTDLIKTVKEKLKASNVVNQNANVDERSFGGRMGEATSAMTRKLALDYVLSPMAKANHLNNEIYEHDLDHYIVGDHNCLSFPIDDALKNGFNTRQTDVRPAKSIGTAFQLLAVCFQLQSLSQFGGVSATHLDWTMVPYVRKSFYKHYVEVAKFMKLNVKDINVDNISIDDKFYKGYHWWNFRHKLAYNEAMKLTIKETNQAVEGMYHNLNTLQSRSGNQLPFTSINYGTCTLTEGRMVIKALLEASIDGVGALHKTSIFPCGIFQCMKGVNRKQGNPNYDLFKLAIKSTSLRLYPNYANVDWSVNVGYNKNDPREYMATMGKRKLSPSKII